MTRYALITLDYPPEQGGVARYLGNLVHASDGAIDVFVEATHQASGPGHVRPVQLVQTAWPHWWPMVSVIHGLKVKGYGLVMVSHALPVGTAAWIAHLFGGPRYAVLLHGLDLRLAGRSRRKAWLLHRILRGASCVLANSQFVSDEIRTFDPTIRPHVLTPGVEPVAFPSRDDARKQLSISDGAFLLLSVARLVPRKGIDRVIEALASLPASAKLVIVGDGDDRARLEALMRERGVEGRVTFVPHATDTERNQWYAAADVFVLPVRDEGNDVEGFGIVYLEAALAGLPVIAGKSGGAVEAIVDGETGLFVDPNDVPGLAATITRLMQDAAARSRMGEKGRTRAQQDFRWKDRWEVFKKVCP